MRVGGVHARVSGKRHLVGLVVVDTTTSSCVGHSIWKAPGGESAGGQLQELYVRAHELLERGGAEALVSWTVDPAPGGAGKRAALIEASRAEGAVMSAAGAVATVKEVAKAGQATVRAEAGGRDTNASVAALSGPITDLPDEDSVRRAAAAAVAWSRRR